MITACQRGSRVGFTTLGPQMLPLNQEQVAQYGLTWFSVPELVAENFVGIAAPAGLPVTIAKRIAVVLCGREGQGSLQRKLLTIDDLLSCCFFRLFVMVSKASDRLLLID